MQPEVFTPPLDAPPTGPRPVIQASPQMNLEATPLRSPVQNIGEQILDSVHACLAREDRQILVRLHPPELGAVLVRLRERGDRLDGVLEVSERDTRREIEQALPQVVRTLQEAGVQVRRLDVATADTFEKEYSRGQFQQDTSSHQQGSGQDRGFRMPSQADSAQGRASYQGDLEGTSDVDLPGSVAPGRIDMLL